jgi:SAM-dependent methyltransferase
MDMVATGNHRNVSTRTAPWPDRVSSWNRSRKWKRFCDEFPPSEELTILDVGFSVAEYQDADNFIEKHYPFPGRVTALTMDDPSPAEARYPDVRIVRYDGVTMPFADGEFDIVWSNAVLEHVGDFERQVAFLRELDRVGARHFITTPNRWFAVEVHTRVPFLHWLPKPWFDAYLRRRGQDWAAGDYMHLLGRARLAEALRRAGIDRFQIRSNRFFAMTLDFIATW